MSALSRLITRCLSFAALVLLTQCSAPVSVHPVNPEPQLVAAQGETKIATALGNIRSAANRIGDGDKAAVSDYNHWVGRLIGELTEEESKPWITPLSVSTSSGTVTLTCPVPDKHFHPESRLIPADTLTFKIKEGSSPTSSPGLGAAVIVVTSLEELGHETVREHLPLRNLTAVVHFEGSTARIELIDPYQRETATLKGMRFPLAANYSAALMLGMSKARIDKLGLVRLLRPGNYANTVHLNFIQPYDPERIPVLFVHGLDSTPATWAPAYFEIIKDPKIRKNYQFWVFSYPSGYAYPYSASLLRHELDAVQRSYPNHRPMVIIGHSMGSLVSRLMVTDAGDQLWITAFGTPPSETPIKGRSRQLLEDCLIFEHRKEISRAVFVSGPHRGSDIALKWFGRLGARLVKLPGLMADVRDATVAAASGDAAALMIKRAPNSVDTLSPENPFVVAINKIPITPGLPYHSIVGDRGRGDTPDSSDGVVPYWSSHLEGAQSEKIVPSGHSAHRHPVGIEEIHRILLLHLKESR